MSEARYAKLQDETNARNAERRKAAWEALAAKGYREAPVKEELYLYANLDRADRERCWRMEVEGVPDATAPMLEKVTVHVLGGGTAGKPPAEELVTAYFVAACRAFRDETALVVERAGGVRDQLRPRPKSHPPLLLAPSGEVVELVVDPRVVATKHVAVKRSCGRMPRVATSDFERELPTAVLWGPPVERPRVSMTYDVEVIEVSCSDYVY